MIEKFKIIPKCRAYRVSNLGRLQSRWTSISTYSELPKPIIVDKWKDIKVHNNTGYRQANLTYDNGVHKSTKIASLVAELFIGPRPKGQVVRHLDGNSKNDNVKNLTYGTYKENENDKKEHGTYYIRGSKLSNKQILEIRKNKYKKSQKELAKIYNVSRETITRIINRTIWKHI